MKILVVSGFLGAGKTTFIKELARRTHRDFAIMENEYGEVGVDGPLLDSDAAEKPSIWELTEGCICCSMKSDFAASVLTIANTVDPEYLIVEPTGVGMLSQVMENLSQIAYDRITLLEPITLVDGGSFDRYLTEYPDIYRDQIAAAKTVLLTKMERADADTLVQLGQKLRAVSPSAQVQLHHYSENPDSWWEALLTRPADPAQAAAVQAAAPVLENLGLTDLSLPSEQHLVLFLQAVVAGVFGEICRAKGYLQAGDAWLHFEVTDRTYCITGISPMADSRGVFIGKDLRRSALREVLQQSLRVPTLRGRRVRAS